MREIKFRAWDGKKMYSPDELIQVGNEGCTTGYYDGSGCPKYSDHELMQYTGLKDKNGKEIYEGDIVLHDGLPGAKNGRSIVFEDCCFMIKGKTPSDDWHVGRYSGLNTEVIGNIYENPELLEDK